MSNTDGATQVLNLSQAYKTVIVRSGAGNWGITVIRIVDNQKMIEPCWYADHDNNHAKTRNAAVAQFNRLNP